MSTILPSRFSTYEKNKDEDHTSVIIRSKNNVPVAGVVLLSSGTSAPVQIIIQMLNLELIENSLQRVLTRIKENQQRRCRQIKRIRK